MTKFNQNEIASKTKIKKASVLPTLFRKRLSLEEATNFFKNYGLDIYSDLLNHTGTNSIEHHITFYSLRYQENFQSEGVVSGILRHQAKANYRESVDSLWQPGEPIYKRFEINASREKK